MGSDREQPSPPPGREPALDAILAALADGPVVIEGEAGIGKTRLLDAVMECSSATRVVAVVATEGTADLGFGSLAPVLDIVGGDHPSATLAAVVDQLTPLRSSERVLLVVDDAHWLDRRSAAAIRLAAGRGAPTLLACRRGEPLPPDVAALARTGTSVELGRLPADALGALARAMLERTLHPTSLAELAERSAGNPLFARELLVAAQRSDLVHAIEGVARASFEGVPASLRMLIEERVAAVDEPARGVLELAAISQGVPLDAAIELHGTPAVEAAEASGMLAADGPAAEVHLDHPLFAEVVAAEVGAARRRRLLGELVRWASERADRRSGRIDSRQLARWGLDAGVPLPTELLAGALRSSIAQRDDALALRLAQALDAIDEVRDLDAEMQLLRVRAWHFAGRPDVALALLADLVPEDGDDALVGARAAVEGEIRFWGLGDAEGGRSAVSTAQARIDDPGWWMSLEVARLTYALLGGAPGEVVDGLAGIAADGPLGYTVASVRVPALVLLGSGAEAVADAAVVTAPAATADRYDEPDEAASERTMAEAAAAFALTEAGDLVGAEVIGAIALRRGTRLGAEPLQSWAALMLGRAALTRGDLTAANEWFSQVANARWEDQQGPGTRWGVAGQLLAASLADDRPAAEARYRTLQELDPGGRLMMESEVSIALAHGAAVCGDDPQPWLDRARLHVARTGSVGLAPAVELAAATLDRPVEPVAVSDGPSPLLAARAAAASALATGEARSSLAAAEALEALGARVDAAVVAAAGLRRAPASRALALTAVRLRRSVPEVVVPLLASLDRPELTPREHQIARLTAEGLTTAQVARAAGCSIRTVENHLHRAYGKLGIAGRADLPDALGTARRSRRASVPMLDR